MPSGGQILVECLKAHGVAKVFTVAGESFLPVLDALHGETRIQAIGCRNEAGAAMMAEATGKLTGRAGVALVTRGPGAANALAGIYIAQQDSTPMLLVIGTPARRMAGRDAFQGIDVDRAFSVYAKWVGIVASASDIPACIARAMSIAVSDRPGPTVLGVPEDVLFEAADVAAYATPTRSVAPPSAAHLLLIKRALAYAERPLAIVGGGGWSPAASRDLASFAERFDLPVATAFRRQDRLDNRHSSYAGHAGIGMDESLRSACRIADVVIAIGTRLGDVTTAGYTLFDRDTAERGQTLIHIAPDADRPDSYYQHATKIAADPVAAVAALASLELPGKRPPWSHWRKDLRSAYLSTQKRTPASEAARLDDIVATLSAMLPDAAVVTNGAGNYAAFLHRYFVYKSYPTQLAPTCGSMGYGLPAAIAAKLAEPDRPVVALAGDGCFQMTGQELATAVQYGAGVVVIVADNASLGTIRMHQERRYPGRVVATTLLNPDFVALAVAYGAHGERVSETAQFPSALSRALTIAKRTRRPALIELSLDIEAIAPGRTLSEIAAGGAPVRT